MTIPQKTLRTTLCIRRGTYKELKSSNPSLADGELVVVRELPWYKSWFGLKPTRLKCGTGARFNDTRFL
jgi:hypothetical protein